MGGIHKNASTPTPSLVTIRVLMGSQMDRPDGWSTLCDITTSTFLSAKVNVCLYFLCEFVSQGECNVDVVSQRTEYKLNVKTDLVSFQFKVWPKAP